jgi:hypothetical protein
VATAACIASSPETSPTTIQPVPVLGRATAKRSLAAGRSTARRPLSSVPGALARKAASSSGAGTRHVGELAARRAGGSISRRLFRIAAARVEHVDPAAVEETRTGHHLLERAIELGQVESDEQGADHLLLQVAHRLQPRDEGRPYKVGPPEVGLAAHKAA